MHKNIAKKQLREFGILIGIVFPLLIGFILPLLAGHTFRVWTLWVGLSSLTLTIFSPRLLLYPYRFWMAIGHALGWVNSRIILGLVFIVVLQPIALIMRLFGYDPLRERKSNAISYKESKKDHKIDLTRIF